MSVYRGAGGQGGGGGEDTEQEIKRNQKNINGNHMEPSENHRIHWGWMTALAGRSSTGLAAKAPFQVKPGTNIDLMTFFWLGGFILSSAGWLAATGDGMDDQ